MDLNLFFLRAGLSESFLGACVFCSAIAGVVFALPAGRTADHFGRRNTLLVSEALVTLGTLVQIAFPVKVVLVPATFMTGMAQTVMTIMAGPIMVEASSEEERTHLFGFQAALSTGFSMLGSYLGGVLPLVFGALAGTLGQAPAPAAAAAAGAGAGAAAATTVSAAAGPLRATLVFGAALNGLALLAILPLRDEKRAATPAASAGETVPWLRFSNPGLVLRLILAQVLVGLGAGFIMPLQNVFMEKHLGATPGQIGLVFSLSSLLTGLGQLAAPFLAKRWGKVRAVTASQLLSLPFLAAMGLVPNLGVYAAASLVRTALMNMVTPVISSFSLEAVNSRERAPLNSLVNMFWNIGWAVCGWAGGLVMQKVSYTLPYAFTMVLYTASVSVFYFSFRSYDPPLARRGRAPVSG